jgi:tryptophan synthase alpha chain
MRRIKKTFNDLYEKGEGAFIAYVTAGDPKPEYTPRIVGALIEGGADIVEVGLPFSDPIADGPTIQAATVRALKNKTTPRMVLKIVETIRREYDTPIVILSYYNPIYRMGLQNFFDSALRSGVDGIIVPDLPIDEGMDFRYFAKENGIDTIFIAAPSTPIERLKKIVNNTSGFLYLVSLYGITGARKRLQELTLQIMKRCLPYTRGKVPLAVGFGISETAHVKTLIDHGADGVIVGSAFVKLIEENMRDFDGMIEKIEAKARSLKSGTEKRLKD